MERYTGQPLPVDQAPTDGAVALAAMTPIVTSNTDGGDGTLTGTDAMDVLDGGRGNDVLSGGDGGEQSGGIIYATFACGAAATRRQRGLGCGLIAPPAIIVTVPEYFRPKFIHRDGELGSSNFAINSTFSRRL